MQTQVDNVSAPVLASADQRLSVDSARALVERHVLPMLLVDSETGEIRHANVAAHRFYGYADGEMLKITVDQLSVLPSASVRGLRARASNEGLRFKSRHRMANGDIRDVAIHSSPIRVADAAMLFSVVVDISDSERTKRELSVRQEQLDMLLGTSVAGYIEADFKSGVTELSEGMRHLMGYDPDEPVEGDASIEAIVYAADVDGVRQARRQAFAAGVPFERRFRLRHKGGGYVWVHGSGRAVYDEAGKVSGFFGTVRDINLAMRLESDLRASEARYRMMFEASPLPMLVIDGRGEQVLEANLAAANLYGYLDRGLNERPVVSILARGERPAFKRLLVGDASDTIRSGMMKHSCANGHLLDVECHATMLTKDGRRTYLVLVHDLTERREAAEAIHRLVTCDTLTQLPNRDSLLKRLEADISRADRLKRTSALLNLNLDSFRAVNDAIGRDGGDELLLEISRRLALQIRTNDMLARIGGDEFAIVVDLLAEKSDDIVAAAEGAAWRIMDSVRAPVRLNGKDYKMTASIGVALFDGDSVSPDAVLRQSDAAVVRAKEAGRDTVKIFDPTQQAQMDLRASLEMDLRRALDEDQFRLFYQVQVDQNGRPMGAEVLLRWYHPGRGMIPPLQFIDLAEVTGMIVPLGRWVLERACQQLVVWAGQPGYETLRLSVNVSARQFREAEFVTDVREILDVTGADPSRLVLELTESLLLDYADEAAARMHELRELGVGFSLDDFGTGYSSMAYLKDLPLDELKIDRTFTKEILEDAGTAVIVRTMIGMARNLGLLLISEGVETEEQLDALVRWGCTGFQGYLFGRPVSIDDFELPEPLNKDQSDAREAEPITHQPASAMMANTPGTA